MKCINISLELQCKCFNIHTNLCQCLSYLVITPSALSIIIMSKG